MIKVPATAEAARRCIGRTAIASAKIAYRISDHGNPAPRLEEGLDQALSVMMNLMEFGVGIDEVTTRLEEGIRKFAEPYIN